MEQKHFIGKLTIDVVAPASADGIALQDAASRLIWDEVAPSLERLFDGLAGADETILIGRLDVSLKIKAGSAGLPDFSAAVVRAIAEQLEKAILYPSASDEAVAARRPLSLSRFSAWLRFLTTGEQPETAASEAEWRVGALETVASDARALDRLKVLFRENPSAVERLVLQHDEPFLIQLAEAISGKTWPDLPRLRRRLFVFVSQPAVAARLENPPTLSERAFEIFFQAAFFERLAASAEKWDEPRLTEFFIEKYCLQVARRPLLVLLDKVAAAAVLQTPSFMRPDWRLRVGKDGQTVKTPEEAAAFFAEHIRLAEIRPALQALNIGDEWTDFFTRAIHTAAPALAAEWAKSPPFAGARPAGAPFKEKRPNDDVEKSGEPEEEPSILAAARAAPPNIEPASKDFTDRKAGLWPPPGANAADANNFVAPPDKKSAGVVKKTDVAADLTDVEKESTRVVDKKEAADGKALDSAKNADAEAGQEDAVAWKTPDKTAPGDVPATHAAVVETTTDEPAGETYLVPDDDGVLPRQLVETDFDAERLHTEEKGGDFFTRGVQAGPEGLNAEPAKSQPFADALPREEPLQEKRPNDLVEKTGKPAAPPSIKDDDATAATAPLKPVSEDPIGQKAGLLPPLETNAADANNPIAPPGKTNFGAVEKTALAADIKNEETEIAGVVHKKEADDDKTPAKPQSADLLSQPQEAALAAEGSGETPAADFLAIEDVVVEIAPDEPAGKTYILANAGVVLLHPFLGVYFETAGLVKDGKFAGRSAQKRAVQLLHFLATGETDVPEYALPLAKALAGLPMSATVDRKLTLTDAERAESEKLLETVVRYWTALGDVSTASLRQGFLTRNGRLTNRNGDWVLTPERQTIDILLDRLPWGFGVVRLSWMRAFLYVEWQ